MLAECKGNQVNQGPKANFGSWRREEEGREETRNVRDGKTICTWRERERHNKRYRICRSELVHSRRAFHTFHDVFIAHWHL
jgi:hypothetical protein